MIGNSSSGLIEVPCYKKGTINLGDRQKGRLSASSVINCETRENEIKAALAKLYSEEFNKTLQDVINPYGVGGASDAILSKIKTISLNGIIRKSFYNLELS